MKKILLMPLVVIGMLFAGSASAADDTTTTFTGSTSINDTDCSLLSQRITMTASSNVIAAWHCSTTTNYAYAGACHTGGSTNPRTVACACTSDGATPPAYTPNNSQCTCDTSGNATPANVEVTGRQAFGGNSNGGIIAAYALDASGTGTCTSTTLPAAPNMWP